MSTLFRFSFQHEHYSHIILVPVIASGLVFLERRRIFSEVATHWWAGSGLIALGALFYSFTQRHVAFTSQNDWLSAVIFALLVVSVGVFALCYGIRALRRGLFPILFFFLIVPIPDFVLNRAVALLVMGSAEISYVLLEVLGVPFLRNGFIFSFPAFTIEIAQECSGIRSSLALLLLSLLVGHLLLRSAWTRFGLVIATLPILIVKNGIRIVVLSLLSMYVDPRFLTGSLHQQGGFVFFLIGMALMVPVLRLLQKVDAKPRITAVSEAQS